MCIYIHTHRHTKTDTQTHINRHRHTHSHEDAVFFFKIFLSHRDEHEGAVESDEVDGHAQERAPQPAQVPRQHHEQPACCPRCTCIHIRTYTHRYIHTETTSRAACLLPALHIFTDTYTTYFQIHTHTYIHIRTYIRAYMHTETTSPAICNKK